MIVVPVNNSVGWLENILYIRVIREPKDVPGSYPFTVCIRDSGGSIVLSKRFTYDFDKDVATYAVDVSSLGEGVYRVYIYNWHDCNPPPNTATFVYWMHKISAGTYLSFDGWDYSRMYVLIMYVYNGKLFWQYKINASDFIVPSNVPVYIEATDRAGNAFVGSVSGNGTIYVRPNMKIPFMAVFRITYGNKVSQDIMRVLSGFVGMIRDAYVSMVDDYTVEVGIVKTEPGVPAIVVGIIVAAIAGTLVGAYGIWAWHDVEVRRFELESKALDYTKPLVDKMIRVFDKMESMLSACSPGDYDCIMKVQSVWLPAAQTLASVVGNLMYRGIPLTRCDGINVSGVCVPWWVVAVAVFLAGLLVISVVRR